MWLNVPGSLLRLFRSTTSCQRAGDLMGPDSRTKWVQLSQESRSYREQGLRNVIQQKHVLSGFKGSGREALMRHLGLKQLSHDFP